MFKDSILLDFSSKVGWDFGYLYSNTVQYNGTRICIWVLVCKTGTLLAYCKFARVLFAHVFTYQKPVQTYQCAVQ